MRSWPVDSPLQAWERLRLRRLASAARRGDRKAFTELYRALHPVVTRYLARRLPNVADVEDLCGKVFTRFIEHLPSYDPGKGSVRGWVLTMARTSLIDHLRTRKQHASLDDTEGALASALADAAWCPTRGLEHDERMVRLRTVLDAFSPSVREMIGLRFGDGLTVREIAVLCGTSEAAMKQRFSRTMRELQAKLRQLDEASGVPYAI